MFCDKLQTLRKENGFSQESLAEKLGVSRQTVAKWEAGDSLPDLGLAVTLARIFGVTLDSLTDNDKTKSSPTGKYAFGTVRMGEKGQIVIPKQCREVFGLVPGDLIMVLGDIERGIALIRAAPEMFRILDTEEEES